MEKSVTLIIADAAEEFRLLCSEAVRRDGIELIATTGDGSELVRLVRDKKPDVLLMDIVLPKLEGFGVLRAINDFDDRKPAVVILSAFTIRE